MPILGYSCPHPQPLATTDMFSVPIQFCLFQNVMEMEAYIRNLLSQSSFTWQNVYEIQQFCCMCRWVIPFIAD